MKKLAQRFEELVLPMKTRQTRDPNGGRPCPRSFKVRIERNLEDANRIIQAYGGERLDADRSLTKCRG